MNDQAIENALAKLADAVRPFIDEYPHDDDARRILAILAPPPSRDPKMFGIVKQGTEALLKRLAGAPKLDEHRKRIAAAWKEVVRDVPLR